MLKEKRYSTKPKNSDEPVTYCSRDCCRDRYDLHHELGHKPYREPTFK